jgi:hypothetical protein
LKFDIDEHNTVQDIPILSNSFVASLMRWFYEKEKHA